MTLSDYMNPATFPATSQKGLTAEQQLMIDAFNHDQLTEFEDEGGTLDERQKAIKAELAQKMPHQAALRAELQRLKDAPH